MATMDLTAIQRCLLAIMVALLASPCLVAASDDVQDILRDYSEDMDKTAQAHAVTVAKADAKREADEASYRKRHAGALERYLKRVQRKGDTNAIHATFRALLYVDNNHVEARQYFTDRKELDAVLAELQDTGDFSGGAADAPSAAGFRLATFKVGGDLDVGEIEKEASLFHDSRLVITEFTEVLKESHFVKRGERDMEKIPVKIMEAGELVVLFEPFHRPSTLIAAGFKKRKDLRIQLGWIGTELYSKTVKKDELLEIPAGRNYASVLIGRDIEVVHPEGHEHHEEDDED